MYQVMFCDEVQDTQVAQFETFDEAMAYWNQYADTPTCFAGELKDILTGEIIWEFSES